MKPRQRCVKCGASCDPDVVKYRKSRGWSILCKTCHVKDIDTRHKEEAKAKIDVLKAEFSCRVCVVCGSKIPWKDTYLKKTKNHWPVTCSPYCHGVYSKRDYKYSRDSVVDRLKTVIIKLGPNASYKDVVKGAHISCRTLNRYEIVIASLVKEVLGISHSRVKATSTGNAEDSGITVAELCALYNMPSCTLRQFTHNVIHSKTLPITDKTNMVTNAVRALITEARSFVSVTAVMRLLGITHDKLRHTYKIDVAEINRRLGYRDKRRSWFEDTAYSMLCTTLGVDSVSREHVFVDCVSIKKYPLRFDFYIPSLNVLIEVDGTQHYDSKNAYHRASNRVNDAIKDVYAASNGLQLYRVNTSPANTFESRFQSLLDVLKPVELLEPLTDSAEGNQQPSP